jgi:HSP20 family molecular chaperone IbpA
MEVPCRASIGPHARADPAQMESLAIHMVGINRFYFKKTEHVPKTSTNFSGTCSRRPGASLMSRMSPPNSPFLLGFDEIERAIERVTRTASDGYPPYNIERIPKNDGQAERLRITLAVAGFLREQLQVTVEESQLVIRGRQQDDKERHYLHRGIAARQFQRVFLLADGMQVASADLQNGLLSVDLVRPEPERVVKKIDIVVRD